jgi:hypothetical protein
MGRIISRKAVETYSVQFDNGQLLIPLSGPAPGQSVFTVANLGPGQLLVTAPFDVVLEVGETRYFKSTRLDLRVNNPEGGEDFGRGTVVVEILPDAA